MVNIYETLKTTVPQRYGFNKSLYFEIVSLQENLRGVVYLLFDTGEIFAEIWEYWVDDGSNKRVEVVDNLLGLCRD